MKRNTPYRISVHAGEKKSICTCNETKTPPFCDGAHKTLGKTPVRITFEKDQEVLICGCTQSKSWPYCDGSHKCL